MHARFTRHSVLGTIDLWTKTKSPLRPHISLKLLLRIAFSRRANVASRHDKHYMISVVR